MDPTRIGSNRKIRTPARLPSHNPHVASWVDPTHVVLLTLRGLLTPFDPPWPTLYSYYFYVILKCFFFALFSLLLFILLFILLITNDSFFMENLQKKKGKARKTTKVVGQVCFFLAWFRSNVFGTWIVYHLSLVISYHHHVYLQITLNWQIKVKT